MADEPDDEDLTFEQKIIKKACSAVEPAPTSTIASVRRWSFRRAPPQAAICRRLTRASARRDRAAWPKDPDEERARKAKNPGPVGAFEQIRDAERPLTPEEIRRGRKAGAARVTAPPRRSESDTAPVVR